MILVGYDIDVLEMRMQELYPVVDYFFLFESTLAGNSVRKVLAWSSIKNQPRFKKFENKTLHFLRDDVSNLEQIGGEFNFYKQYKYHDDTWMHENIVRETVQLILFELYKRNILQNTDVAILGDIDEIPNPDILLHLKYCEDKTDPVKGLRTSGLIFYYKSLFGIVFRNDYPKDPDLEYSFERPRFVNMQAIDNKEDHYLFVYDKAQF